MAINGGMKRDKAGKTLFPRGKAAQASKVEDESTLLPDHVVKKKVKTVDRDEDLFGKNNKDASKIKKKKKDKKKSEDADDDAFGGLKVTSADSLTYSSLTEGQTLLGCVSSVSDYSLRVSLPGRLVGTVPITAVSKPYTAALEAIAKADPEDAESAAEKIRTMKDMFKAGQPLVVSVTKLERRSNDGSGPTGHCKVTLSAAPQVVHAGLGAAAIRKGLVLQSAVKSVEDHGYVMDVGVGGLTAFLPKKKAKNDLAVGQLIPALVTKGTEGGASRSISLTADPEKLARATVDPKISLSVHTLIPGTAVKATLDNPIKHGIRVKFGNGLKGYVNMNHLLEDLESIEEGAPMTLRVLYVVPTLNAVYLSAKKHLTFGSNLENPFVAISVGASLKKVEVVRSGPQGLLLKLNDTEVGFVAPRQVSDAEGFKAKDIRAKHPVGSSVSSCRVIQFDYCEQAFVCSMKKAALSEKIVQWEQLVPGEKVGCRLKEYVDGGKGALVEVGKNMTGFIPAMHLSDVPLKNPEKKYPVGSKLKCRVLKAEPEKRRLHLTAKSILVNEEYPIVADYDPSHVGEVTEGTVSIVKSQGLLLELFGGAKGWVPKSKLSTEEIEYPEKLFFLGQVLKCEVVNTEPERERMTLSLIIGGTHRPLGEKQRKMADNKVKVGSFYDCVVKEKKEDGLSVSIVGSDVDAFLPTNHLTDHKVLAESLLESYHEGEVIREAMCFERDVVPVMTIKPMIVNSVKDGSAPKSFADLQEGVSVVGAICLVKDYGVFLRLPTSKFRKSALVPMRHLTDTYVEDPRELFSVHQTLVGKVLERHEGDQKVTMSAKPKDVRTGGGTEMSVELTKSMFRDFAKVRESATGALSTFMPGLPTTCTVTKSTELGIFVDVQGVNGIITNAGLAGLANRPTSVGDLVSAVVLFVDVENECLELTAQPDVVKRVTMAGKKDPKPDIVARAVCVLKKTEFDFVSMMVKTPHAFSGKLVHVPTRHHVNDQAGFADLYTVGDVYNVVIKSNDDSIVVGTLEKHENKREGGGRGGRKRTRLNSESGERKRTESESSIGTTESKRKRSSDSESDQRQRIESESSETREETTSTVTKTTPSSTLSSDPGWDADFNPFSSGGTTTTTTSPRKSTEETEEGEEGSPTKKKKMKTHISKKEKKALDKLEAEEIARAEQRVLDGEEAEPETVDEFERLVLSSPNSSLCWIKYAAFHLERKEQDKAREVVHRALEKINFREESERLNVYVAWLNLEVVYNDGGGDNNEDAVEDVLAKALKFCDQFTVYPQAAQVFASSGQPERAEKLYKAWARKFCKEPEVWARLGHFYFAQANLKEARFTLQRALQNLETKHHVDISSKFGQLEFKMGEPERAKEIFQKILDNFPRRTDIWMVYVDQLAKKGEIETARNVFEGAISLNLQPKKMKALFKRYVDFETAHGDPASVDRARRKALEYVESKLGVAEEAGAGDGDA